VILTTSAAAHDIALCYDAGANTYIVKPTAFGSLVQVFKALCAYWFDVSTISREGVA
jgi:DNA-binding response OmpR family regulator